MIKKVESFPHFGIGLPAALRRTPFPPLTLTTPQQHRGLSARKVSPQSSCLWVILLFAGSVLHPEIAPGQEAPSHTAVQAPSMANAAHPVVMTECEGVNNCATWTFLGAQGNGQWPSGEVANLNVERYDNASVVIRRADSTGPSAGLTAVYTGTRHGDRVGGEFASSWPGHWDNKSGNWYATVERNPLSSPSVMHFCGDTHCFTLELDNGRYVGRYAENGVTATSTWTVESFTRKSVVFHRTDSTGYAAVIAGEVSKEDNRIINGTLDGQAFNYRLSWGTALNATPGSDAERGRGRPTQQRVVVVRPGPVCFPWFFTVICE